MAKKIKLSDAAKDLNVSSQEIMDFFAEKGDTKKKASTSLTEEEMNIVLEHYTKLHEVKTFDEYFASKNDPKPEPKEEPKAEKKPKTEKKTEKAEKTAKAAPKKEEKKPAAETEKPAVKAAEPKPDRKSVV